MWTAEDMALALEWQAEKNLRCEGCGHHLDETLSAGAARAYEADEMTCHACQVIEWRREALSEQSRDMGGLRIYATRRAAGHV